MFQPGYINLYKTGKLRERIEKAQNLLKECQICPRRCNVNRLENKVGICKVGRLPKVSSYNPHFGEELPLVGMHGSGTIFITSCNLGSRAIMSAAVARPWAESDSHLLPRKAPPTHIKP